MADQMEFSRDYLEKIERQIDLTPEVLADLRFTDVEASSLFKLSFPIEVATTGLEMVPEAMLIRPLPHWDDWSTESQGVHNISRAMLERDGVDAALVAHRMNVLHAGRYVFSDNPGFDNNWYQRLYADVDVRKGFQAQEYDGLFLPCVKIAVRTMSPSDIARLERKVELVYLHTHRAGDDVLKMAARLRYLVDPEWCAWFDKADYSDVMRSLGKNPETPQPSRRRK